MHQCRAVAEEDDRQLGVVEALFLQEAKCIRVRLRVEPLVGDAVAREEVADCVIHGRPAHSDDSNSFKRRLVAELPASEQIVQHGIELLFGRIPWFVQVVVNFGRIDGADGSFCVRVGGEENALGVGIDRQGLLEEVDSGHAGHALVREEEGDRVLSHLKLAAYVERSSPGGGADDAVVLAVMAAQVLDHSFQYAGVVVDG